MSNQLRSNVTRFQMPVGTFVVVYNDTLGPRITEKRYKDMRAAEDAAMQMCLRSPELGSILVLEVVCELVPNVSVEKATKK
jgi:hypothetical protein